MIAIPRDTFPLREAVHEVACLTRKQYSSELAESIPLALAEIPQIPDDPQEQLQTLPRNRHGWTAV